MRRNLPVTGNEILLADGSTIVSKTNAKGVIEDELFQSTFGGHLVAGAQVKIPILPFALFVDGKWYLNTAVSEAASNYPFSVSAGIGFAL